MQHEQLFSKDEIKLSEDNGLTSKSTPTSTISTISPINAKHEDEQKEKDEKNETEENNKNDCNNDDENDKMIKFIQNNLQLPFDEINAKKLFDFYKVDEKDDKLEPPDVRQLLFDILKANQYPL